MPERPALFAFAGDVYTGFEAYTLDEAGVAFAQNHVRMLSGLYGLLRPLDAIRPYRLEMGTRWASRRKSVTDWWGSRIVVREQDGTRAWDMMTWDVLGGQAKWKMTNVRQLGLPQWRRLAERPENRCVVPLTEFCEFTPEKHDLGDGKPPLKGEMWFQVVDQPVFAVAGFWRRTKEGNGFMIVTCDSNALVEPIHLKAMITILDPGSVDTWLGGSYDEIVALQRPYDPNKMTVRGPVFPTRRDER